MSLYRFLQIYNAKQGVFSTKQALPLKVLCHFHIRENKFLRATFCSGAHNTAVTPILQKLLAKLGVSLRGKAASQISMGKVTQRQLFRQH